MTTPPTPRELRRLRRHLGQAQSRVARADSPNVFRRAVAVVADPVVGLVVALVGVADLHLMIWAGEATTLIRSGGVSDTPDARASLAALGLLAVFQFAVVALWLPLLRKQFIARQVERVQSVQRIERSRITDMQAQLNRLEASLHSAEQRRGGLQLESSSGGRLSPADEPGALALAGRRRR